MRTLASFLPIAGLRARAIAEARALTERWDVPATVTLTDQGKPVPVPPDLVDRIGRFHRTRDGYRIAGRMLLDDVRIGSQSPVAPILISINAVLAALAVVCGLLPHGMLLIVPLCAAMIVTTILAYQGGQTDAHPAAAAVWSAILGAGTTAALLGVVASPLASVHALPIPLLIAPGLLIAAILVIGFALDHTGVGQPLPGEGSNRPGIAAALALNAAAATRAGIGYLVQFVAVIVLLSAGTALGGVTGWLLSLLALIPAAATGWIHTRALAWDRSRALLAQSAHYTGEDFGPDPSSTAPARAAQALAAVKDSTPLVVLGTATGHLSTQCGDFFAPDPGLRLAASLRDLETHIAVFGTTGTGKTSGVLRPLVRAWLQAQAGGVLILDGKAALPAEFRGEAGYTLLDPADAHVCVALMEGLAPEDVSAAIQSTAPDDHGDNAGFFKASAAMLLTHALVLLRLFADDEIASTVPDTTRVHRWSPMGLTGLIAMLDSTVPPPGGEGRAPSALIAPLLEVRKRALPEIGAALDDKTTTLGMAAAFLLGWHDQDDRTRSNIRSTLDTWLQPLALHPRLLPWAAAEHGVDPTTVLRGAAMGLLLPETTYGQAGRLTAALIRARIYKALRERGDLAAARQCDHKQTRCLLMIDEAQEVLTLPDRQIAAVARSLGLTIVIATQSVDALQARFSGAGGHEATALLDNFASIIALRSSAATSEYVRARAGKGWRRNIQSTGPSIAWTADAAAVASTAAFDPGHPDAARYTKLRRRLPRGLDHGELYSIQPATVTWEKSDIISHEDWSALLAEPFMAVALIQRAGAPRRDFIRLKPMFPGAPAAEAAA